ncbi:aminotransferase class I/II-fold pyridoxal phosphate-dependent enzyme [Allobaculum sp. Allo2]|uniref:aminotransferase class I/II-fold pyridoxal phosphate-dependent enzyme n=1 Tax=Allobaculum sp. Allo2 TaxID=2853432 RepID=UPI001F625507|nr:aminotransferase class I/II-fold pyridoxal phosphate-dependent enzyme [Allobaculum sp. Allo2]UNT93429.1 aminotransferase class I/II-fold pyridoxal phosphate-dependent enzyme [Allobaculum sp. Allo2]
MKKSDPDFPSSLWFKTMRLVMSRDQDYLMQTSPAWGSARLRNVIALYLHNSRHLQVHPDQIVIASGAQDLYVLLARMFAGEFHVAFEAPGYPAMRNIYASMSATLHPLPLDENGIQPDALQNSSAQFLQVSPFRAIPTASSPVHRGASATSAGLPKRAAI